MGWMREIVDAVFSVWVDDPLAEPAMPSAALRPADAQWFVPTHWTAPTPARHEVTAMVATPTRPVHDVDGYGSMTRGELARAVTD